MPGKKNPHDSGASTGGTHHQCGHPVFVLKINDSVKIYKRLRDLKTGSDASEHPFRCLLSTWLGHGPGKNATDNGSLSTSLTVIRKEASSTLVSRRSLLFIAMPSEMSEGLGQ